MKFLKNGSEKYPEVILLILLFSFPVYSQNWDTNLLKSVNRHYNSNTARYVNHYENAVYYMVIGIPLGLILYGNIAQKDNLRMHGLKLAISEIAAYFTTYLLKISVNRNRPYESHEWVQHDILEWDASFPSGHTNGSAVLTTYLLLNVENNWEWKIPALIWTVTVGIGRMYQGVHYPSDILAGALIGTGSTILVHKFWPDSGTSLKPNNYKFPLFIGFGLFYGRTPGIFAQIPL